jgi:hypothetical protein
MAFEIHYTPDIRRIIQECSSNFRADLFADNKNLSLSKPEPPALGDPSADAQDG